jgi:tRNA A-37 threonylcarbamoyl transferase component Bud32
MNFMSWIFVLFLLGAINGIIGLFNVKGFLDNHSKITGPHSLEVFKKMVRQQMTQALVQIGILVPMVIIGLSGVVKNRITGTNFVLWIMLNLGIFGIGKMAKNYEDQARSLQIMDQTLEEQYKQVCESWIKKPLPNF